ncbi:ketopantoate reductase family protein [Roseomonas sp. BN140053]|uniref:ketopantoate reductase family protein n=1 Tax=Roseomonas sp. BN140053 TaxID=3391898 RepID=UPI0039E7D6FD
MGASAAKSVLIVGCGAIGGVLAAKLAPLARVVALDTDAAHVAAIRAEGLRLTGVTAATARIEAVPNATELAGQHFDAVIFLVKSAATEPAARALLPVLEGRPWLVTLQNGMGNAETLCALSDLPVARGVAMQAGRFAGPGQVEHLIDGAIWLGPVRGDAADLRWLGALLNDAGLSATVLDEPMGAVWSKFVFNAVMNPVGALLLGNNAARYEVPEVRELIDEMAAECIAVVEALGGTLAFDPMDFVKKIRTGQAPLSRHAGSMALDVARGAPLEVDELTGFVVREAARLGIPVPNCRAVFRLTKGLEYAAQRRRETEKEGNGA